MSIAQKLYYQVEARAYLIWRCDKCGATKRSEDRMSVKLDLRSSKPTGREVGEVLERLQPSNSLFPIGWSSHGYGVHHCPLHDNER